MIICDSEHLKYPLLGRNWLDPLWRSNWLNQAVNNVQHSDVDYVSMLSRRFPNVFACKDASSAITGFTVNIVLRENVMPVFRRPYSLPYALHLVG